MQRKAMERVREMKRTSDAVTQSAQREFNSESNKKFFSEPVSPKITNMPPNFPKDTVYPSFKTVFEEEKERMPKREQPEKRQVKAQSNNAVEKLFAEPDKALLLGLIMLLKSEKADEGLIIALTYILS
jgi:hypothetical protein